MRVIPQLLGNFISWGGANERDSWPAEIAQLGGIEPLLEPGVMAAEFKRSGLKALGIVVDANSDPVGRWNRIRQIVEPEIPDIPVDLPPEGLICNSDRGVRFGVWLMPDNRSHGMLETFLRLFVQDPTKGLWPVVEKHCREAKALHGAPYLNAHIDKALIHSWLAVQDPPGQQLHIAVMQKILRPTSPLADPFVNWFRTLFDC